jgi:hypothetical protein
MGTRWKFVGAAILATAVLAMLGTYVASSWRECLAHSPWSECVRALDHSYSGRLRG